MYPYLFGVGPGVDFGGFLLFSGGLGGGSRSRGQNSWNSIIKTIIPSVVGVSMMSISVISVKPVIPTIGVPIGSVGVPVGVRVGPIKAAVKAVVPRVVSAVGVDNLGFGSLGGGNGGGGGVGGGRY